MVVASSHRALFYGGIGLLATGILLFDWLLPAGLNVELLQVAVILLTLFVEGRRPTVVFGGLTTLFVFLGYANHWSQQELVEALANHGIVLLGIWVAVAVVLAYKHVLRARQESEARAQAILNATADGIITIDEEGTIESFNRAAQEIFGAEVGEVVGMNVETLFAPAHRDEIEGAFRPDAETGRAQIVGAERELQGRRGDGTTFPMDLAVSEVELADRRLLTAVVRDITERKQDERRLSVQYLTAQILTESDSFSEAAPRLLRTICKQLDWAWGELWIPNEEGNYLENAEIWRSASVPRPTFRTATHRTTFEPGEGLPGSVWEEGRTKWLSDVRRHDNFVRAQAAAEADMRTGFAFPIQLETTVFGVMVFFSSDIRQPDEGLLQMFTVLGNQIGQFTNRRQTEETLQKTADRLSRAQEVARLGSWEYDFEAKRMIWSEQMYRLFGVDETFTPRLETLKDFLPSKDRRQFEEALQNAVTNESSFRFEHRLVSSEGSERWMFTQAEVETDGKRLVGTTLDITELKQTKKALQESEARAQAILETTVDGIITIDRKGTIESFNQAAEEIFGYEAEEVIGKNVKVLMPSPYREEHDEYLRSYHETGRRNIIGVGREVTGKRKDGSTFPMDLAVSEVDLGDRTIFTGIVRDISERRRLEKEILNISEQEQRRIGQDLHDGLGQMLTGIGLLSQNVARRLEEKGHEQAEDVAEITEHIKEADQYARDLSHGLIPVDIEGDNPSALTEALNRLTENAEQLHDLDCTFEEVGTPLIHDNNVATHLYRITQEAFNNAVRHGDADRVRIVLAAADGKIRLHMRDDGVGFDQEDNDGSGMGVRIMNYRARIVGGTLEISSSRGEGTTVTCTVPRTGSGADAATLKYPGSTE